MEKSDLPSGGVHDILSYLPDAVVSVDEAQTIVFFNDAAEEIFGYRRDEVLGQPLDILLPPRARNLHRKHVAQFQGASSYGQIMNQRGEIAGRRKDGRLFPAEASIVKTATNGERVLTAIVRDVSARRQAEARIAASEARHRAILEASPDAVLIADADTGFITEANEAACALFGCGVDHLVGLHQTALHPPGTGDLYSRYFREHIESGRILVPDGEIQKADGAIVPVEIAAKPIPVGDEVIMVGFFRDITHRRERERALLEAREEAVEAHTAKTRFFANMNHELRTPLNGVIGMAEMLDHQVFGPLGHEKYREYARDIRTSGEHLMDVINDLISISTIDLDECRLQEEVCDLEEVVEECRRMMARLIEEANVDFVTRIEPGFALRADGRNLRQMLLNLISNAVKFTPAPGTITVTARVAADGRGVVGVADTGLGIRPERLAVLGRPFETMDDPYARNQQGLGLGLAITKGLVERHGGRLEIESEPGVGTTVSLVFPAGRLVAPGHQ